MIHVFEACGQKMALDVGSGAVHVLDDLAFDALALGDRPRAELEALLAQRHAPEAVCEMLDELESLRAGGELDAADEYDESIVLQPGVVKAMCLHAAHDCNLR
ncbi:MAG TPA: thioether cross-link-forming SCIFF peptide maturase, partial [Clostridia bacterium]|nr:thioether cross-link-forming SCIFF peptide maturase [Clostridia bacterium]